MTQKGVVIIDIGKLRRRDISHREIETHRESSSRGSNPMEACTSGSKEIKLIIVVVPTIVWKQQLSSNSSNTSRSNFTLHVAIPPGVRWSDVGP